MRNGKDIVSDWLASPPGRAFDYSELISAIDYALATNGQFEAGRESARKLIARLREALREVNSIQHQMAIELDAIPQQPRIEYWTREIEKVCCDALGASATDSADEQIDTSDIPEITDWSKAVRGKFYRGAAAMQAKGEGQWEVVPNSEGDNWGIRRAGENYGKSIAQMLWEEDAKYIVDLHNERVQANGEGQDEWWHEAASDVMRHAKAHNPVDWESAIKGGLLRAYNRGKGERVQAAREPGPASDKDRLSAWMIQHGFDTGHGDTFEDLLDALTWQVAERRNPDERTKDKSKFSSGTL